MGIWGQIFLLASLLALLSGCAIQYYDAQTGTEHLWGWGHLKMRAIPLQGDQASPTNAIIACVTGTSILGLNLGAGGDFEGFTAGWDSRSRVVIKQDSASFYLLWPTNATLTPLGLKNPFIVRIGTNFPTQLLTPKPVTP